MRNFRKALTPVIEAVAVALVVLDIGLGIGVGWLSGKVTEQKRLEATAKAKVEQAQLRVARLQSFDDVLPGAEGQLDLFLKKRVPARRQAYSRALHLVRVLTQQAGVQLTEVAYKVGSDKEGPLARLELSVGVTGSFGSLIKFSHSLETATDFIVVRSFAFAPGDNGQLALRLTADLYMNP